MTGFTVLAHQLVVVCLLMQKRLVHLPLCLLSQDCITKWFGYNYHSPFTGFKHDWLMRICSCKGTYENSVSARQLNCA